MASRLSGKSVTFSLADTMESYEPVDLPGHEGRPVALHPEAAAARYVERAEIGRGGFGVVLEAFDQDLRRTVAIKRLRSDASSERTIASLVKEAQITAQLEHPNVPSVHALGIDADGHPFFSMTRLGGYSLGELLARSHKDPALARELSNARLLRIFLQAAYAVAFAHSRGVVHRDLKPDNVIIGDFGEVRVMDWGLAKVLSRPEPEADGESPEPLGQPVHTSVAGAETREGVFLGTPGYAAPEQFEPDEEVDERTDIYALGATLYAMLAGRPPVVGESLVEVMQRTLTGDIPPVKRYAPVSDPQASILHKALALAPADRYQRVLDMIADVEALLEGRRVGAHEAGALARFGRWYFSRTPATSRLRAVDIDLLCGGSLVFGLGIGAYSGGWLAGWEWLACIFGALLCIPGSYAFLRKPRPDDPGVVIPFTEGLASSGSSGLRGEADAEKSALATAPTAAADTGEPNETADRDAPTRLARKPRKP